LSLTNKPDKIKKCNFAYFCISIALLILCIHGSLQRKLLKPVDSNIYAPSIRTACFVNNSASNIFTLESE
jgi:hypothetical protein